VTSRAQIGKIQPAPKKLAAALKLILLNPSEWQKFARKHPNKR
jgi:hypothetical protein